MTIPRQPAKHDSPRAPFDDDRAIVPLAISLTAFTMSCAVLFGLVMTQSASLLQGAVAIVVIAAAAAASWHLQRLHRRRRQRFEAQRSAALPTSAPAAVAVRRLSELPTTACRYEPSSGRAFNVRCFGVDCTSPLGCRDEESERS